MTGWKLVPAEPTPEMLDAMQAAGIAAFDADVAASLGDAPLDPTHARRAIWRAALDAAPEAPNAEPVAWRYKPMIGSPWSMSDDGYYISCKRDAGYIIEALAVVQPAPSAEPMAFVCEPPRGAVVRWATLAAPLPPETPLYTFRPEGVRLTGKPVAWRISGRFGWTYQEEPPYESQRGRIAEPLYQHPQPDHRKAMQMALHCMERMLRDGEWYAPERAIDALRAALGERDE